MVTDSHAELVQILLERMSRWSDVALAEVVVGSDRFSMVEDEIVEHFLGHRSTLADSLKVGEAASLPADQLLEGVGRSALAALGAPSLVSPLLDAGGGNGALVRHLRARELEAVGLDRAYVRILRSLRPAGAFADVPSLPFIEQLLDPGEFSVTRQQVPFTGVSDTHVRRCP